MSVDFNFVLSADSGSPLALEEEVCRRMKELGYRAAPELIPVEFDDVRGVYDEIDSARASARPEVAGWAREYDIGGCILYMVLAARKDCMNGYVDISGELFNRWLATHEFSKLLRAVGGLAETMNAVGGFGSFEQTLEPITADRIVDCIEHVPTEGGEPATHGLVAFSIATHADIIRRFGGAFEVAAWTGGYWLLTHRDLI